MRKSLPEMHDLGIELKMGWGPGGGTHSDVIFIAIHFLRSLFYSIEQLKIKLTTVLFKKFEPLISKIIEFLFQNRSSNSFK